MLRISKNIVYAALFFFLLWLFCAGRATVSAAVLINEIYPKTDPQTLEWIELYNNGPETVSLDRWKLQNAAGLTFSMNASSRIEPNNFLTFDQSQMGISFSVEGDTVRLYDENNNLQDTQSYPGTLGWNTSMGRSTDGAGIWTVCDPKAWTKNLPNNCPPPPTPLPTVTPVPTLTPVPSPTATLTPVPSMTPETVIRIPEYKVPLSINNPGAGPAVQGTSTEAGSTQHPDQLKLILAGLSIGIGAAAFVALAIGLFGKFKRRRESRTPPPVA